MAEEGFVGVKPLASLPSDCCPDEMAHSKAAVQQRGHITAKIGRLHGHDLQRRLKIVRHAQDPATMCKKKKKITMDCLPRFQHL